jgi:ribonuclease G
MQMSLGFVVYGLVYNLKFPTLFRYKYLNNEVIINTSSTQGRIAILKDKKLVEYHLESPENGYAVGDIFLGVIKKVVPGSNAAFVDIGFEKDAFLHYSDLGDHYLAINEFIKSTVSRGQFDPNLEKINLEAKYEKTGKISDVLKTNHLILGQVVKEPISSKGHRLTCELSLAGRFVVLVPFSNQVSVSKKITSQTEKKRLLKIITSIKPNNFGVIIRTVAENQDIEDLHKDLLELLDRWGEAVKTLLKTRPKQKILGEISKSNSLLRDLLNESFDSIVVDEAKTYEQIKEYVKTIAPEKEEIVKLYSGKSKIFETYGVEKQLNSLFGRTVNLISGGYLVVEHTEALHVIDVNSGNKSNSEESQESTAFHVNLEAVEEIARQLRLRDIGGIIVIDFIDMKSAESKKIIYEKMKEAMRTDRSRHTVLPLSKFGLMQITRQRFRPELIIETKPEKTSKTPVNQPIDIDIIPEIETSLEHLFKHQNESQVQLVVHPYLHAFLTKGWIRSKQWNWAVRFRHWVRIKADKNLKINEFKLFDKNLELIEFSR